MEQIITYLDEEKVLDCARLNLFQGEIIGVVGLNNAGKSVLVGGITGVYPCTSGRIFFEEEELYITSIKEAREKGIFYIQPDSSLMDTFTVAENIFLTKEKNSSFFINRKLLDERTEDILKMFGLGAIGDIPISELDNYDKLVVEICKAFVSNTKIIVLDGILTELEANQLTQLQQLLNMLASLQISIIIIEQYVRKILSLCDRLFILNSGRTVGTLDKEEFDINRIVSLMIGHEVSEEEEPIYLNAVSSVEETVLLFQDVCYKNILNRLSFDVKKNEIVGILNVDRYAKDTIIDVLSGIKSITGGRVLVEEKEFHPRNMEDSINAKISIVSDKYNFFKGWTVEEIINFPALKRHSSMLGILNKSELRYITEELIGEYILKEKELYVRNRKISADRLMQKKIALCRGLSINPKLLVLINPIKGIDIISKDEIYKDINSLKAKNIAILVISSDLNDLTLLCDRMLIIKYGSVVDAIDIQNTAKDKIFKKYGRYLKQM